MTNTRSEIISWLNKQQEWLQDAAEKLLSVGMLTEEHIADIVKSLKAGTANDKQRNFENLTGTFNPTDDLRLVSIGDIHGIENLAPRTPLNFGKGNLVVVYGRNGSGKSGYTRILKRACGKPRAAELKPNVFQTPPSNPKCCITYLLADRESCSQL